MIKHLILENFKCLDTVKLPLGGLTVLAGLNGMGKSSVLQALLLLQQSSQTSLDERIHRLALNGSLTNLGTAKDALWEGADEEKIVLGVQVEDDDFVWEFQYHEGDDELKGLGENPDSLPSGIGLFSESFNYLRAERMGPKSSFPISVTAVKEQRQIGIDGENAPFFLSVFGSEELQNEALLHPEATSKQLRHQVEAWLGEISPGTRLYTEAHTKLDLVSLEYAFASSLGETNHYRATNVGFGITYILPIVLAVLAAKEHSLVLLENPEAHLHPRGQVKMGEMLALASLAGVQIVVETHSDHLLNGIRLAVHSGRVCPDDVALHYFERVQDDVAIRAKITSPTMDTAGRIDEWPDGFFDENEKVLRKLLVPPAE